MINEAPEIDDLMFWIPTQVKIMPPLAYSMMCFIRCTVHSMMYSVLVSILRICVGS